MYLSRIRITLRRSILDPQGKAVQHAVESLGLEGVSDIRMGKYVEMKVESDSETEAMKRAERVCQKLLANPVMEDYHVELEKIS